MKPTSIDDYLSHHVPDEAKRAALQTVRESILKAAPGAEECISYSMPAFRLHGKVIAGFAAAKNHCAYYPFSGSTLGTLKAELAGYDQSKSALRFPPGQPLPDALVRTLIQARLAEL